MQLYCNLADFVAVERVDITVDAATYCQHNSIFRHTPDCTEVVIIGELQLSTVHITEEGGSPVVYRQDGRVVLYGEYVLAATAHSIDGTWGPGEVTMMLVGA